MKYRLTSPCRGSNTFDALPEREVCLSPEKMCSLLRGLGLEIKVESDVMAIGQKGSIEVAIYRRGKAIIKNVKERKEADALARKIFSKMG
ncbi:MAG: hypothetical protein N3H30_00535 [Candidatus Micrarchaeota archaeon]|nr:hypothetical protein [Candidatus Micrarchaeota archaeon]